MSRMVVPEGRLDVGLRTVQASLNNSLAGKNWTVSTAKSASRPRRIRVQVTLTDVQSPRVWTTSRCSGVQAKRDA